MRHHAEGVNLKPPRWPFACRQVKDDMEEDGEPPDSGFLRTVRTAAYRVKEHPARICNAATLEAVKGIGPALSRVCVRDCEDCYSRFSWVSLGG